MESPNPRSAVSQVLIGELKTLKPNAQVFQKKVACSNVYFLTTSKSVLAQETLNNTGESPAKQQH